MSNNLIKKNGSVPGFPDRKPDKTETYAGKHTARVTKVYNNDDGSQFIYELFLRTSIYLKDENRENDRRRTREYKCHSHSWSQRRPFNTGRSKLCEDSDILVFSPANPRPCARFRFFR